MTDAQEDQTGGSYEDHRLSEFRAERPLYAWRDRWLTDALGIVSGRGGAGKTTYTLDKLALATVGKLPGEYLRQPMHVALVGALEDGTGAAKLRMTAAGADLDMVHVPKFFRDGIPESFTMSHLDDLMKFITDHEIKFVMFDLLNSLIRDDTKRSDVVKVLPFLNEAAHETKCAIIGINHFRKSGGIGGDLMSGSAAIRDNTRSLILMAKNENGERVATLDKLNLSLHEGESWKFDLKSVTVQDDNGMPTDIGSVVELGTSNENVETIVNRLISNSAPGQDSDGHNEIQEFILGFLADHGGSATSREVIDAARADGFTEQRIKDARRRCKDPSITSTPRGSGNDRSYLWSLAKPVGGTEKSIGGIGGVPVEPPPMPPMASPMTEIRSRQSLCSVCGQPMAVFEPGQTTHPGCSPVGAA